MQKTFSFGIQKPIGFRTEGRLNKHKDPNLNATSPHAFSQKIFCVPSSFWPLIFVSKWREFDDVLGRSVGFLIERLSSHFVIHALSTS